LFGKINFMKLIIIIITIIASTTLSVKKVPSLVVILAGMLPKIQLMGVLISGAS